MSAYFWHSEGMTARNRDILEAAGQHIRCFKGPWLLAGDFNMTPTEFKRDAENWLAITRGMVIQPDGPTCRGEGPLTTVSSTPG